MARTRPRSDALTDLDHRILSELRANARLSFRMLAQRLGVSTPTVSKRVQRMERAGIIQGYTVVTPELPDPASPRATILSCAHCKNPIEGPPRFRTFEAETRAFCCELCGTSWLERRAKAGPSPGTSLVAFVVLGPVFSFGFVLLACASSSCLAVASFHPEATACVPAADRLRQGALGGAGVAALHAGRGAKREFGHPPGAATVAAGQAGGSPVRVRHGSGHRPG